MLLVRDVRRNAFVKHLADLTLEDDPSDWQRPVLVPVPVLRKVGLN